MAEGNYQGYVDSSGNGGIKNKGSLTNKVWNFGVDDVGMDVKFFGDTSGAYMLWDQSGNTLSFAGGASITLTSAYRAIADDTALTFGTDTDITAQFVSASSKFQISTAADDALFEIGKSATTQLSFDVKWFAGQASGASYLYMDASADLIYTVGIDFQFKDSDYLVFGTGSGATGDVQIAWDTANLIISASADDTLIEIGDANATQKSFDVKIYGNAANGADYLFWDASGSVLTTIGAAYIAGRTNDANGIGIAVSVKTTTGDPGTTGTPAGSIVLNTFDATLNCFDGSSWVGVGLT